MKKIILLLTLTMMFGQDTEPPYYLNDPNFGPSLSIYSPNEVVIENSIASFNVGFSGAEWVYENWQYFEDILGIEPGALFDDGSGIKKFGFRFLSPSGEIDQAYLQGDCNLMSVNTSGSWGEYVIDPWSECFNYDSGCGGCIYGDLYLNIPMNQLELGSYEVSLLVQDFAENELVISGDEFENLGGNDIITFSTTENNSIYNIYDDYSILTWDWGVGENIIVQESALNIFSTDDTLYAIDENALISGDCEEDEPFGAAILYKRIIQDENSEFSLYCNASIDNCDNYNTRYPGYSIGNEMKFLLYDQSIDEYINLEPNYSSGNGIFGAPFDDTLTFKYYDASANMVYDLEESLVFITDMIEGDAINPSAFTIDYSTQTPGAPNWNFDFHYYEFNGSITSAVYDYGELLSDEGDIIAAFVNSECRGSIEASVTPDPIFEDVVFHLMVYANPTITRISSFEIINDRHSRDLTDYTNLESESNYKYNVYKNDILLEASYEENFIIDYDLDDGESCYEVYLIDNYDNSEFLTTDPFCLYYEPTITGCSLLGDSTGDGLLNVLDIVNMVSYIMGNSTMDENALICSDVNQDNNINVLDVVASVAIIIGN